METTADPWIPDYVIATVQGAIPYIVDTDRPFLKRPRLVYLDDFLYKDSFYHRGGRMHLKDFIASDTEVYLAAKGLPSLLKSKRGHLRIDKATYDEISARMGVEVRPDYKTGAILVNGTELSQPADLDEFVQLVEKGVRLFGTGFINDLTEAGRILAISDGILATKSILDSDYEYVKHMYSIREMNAFAFMSELNYQTLHDYFTMLRRGCFHG